MTGVFLVIHCFAVSQYLDHVNETELDHEGTYAFNFEGDYLTSVSTISDSNWVQSGWNILQFKQYDENYEVIRETRFQDSLHVYQQGANLVYSDGFYYYSGFYDSLYYQGNENAYVVKYGNIGNLIWMKDYFSNIPNTRITHLKKHENRLFIGGYHNYQPDSTVQHSFVGEIDTAGNLLWSKTFNDNGNTTINNFHVLSSEDLIVSSIYSGGPQNKKTILHKINTSGEVEWSRTFGINGPWLSSKLVPYELPDGTILCYGGISDPDGAEFARSWLCKLNAQGSLIKDTIYKFSVHNDGFSIWYDEPIIKNDEILLLGRYRKDGTSPKNSYLASIDFDLNLNWIRIHGDHTNKNELTFLHNLENGFYLMSGHINDEALNDPVVDEWFMVVDSLGCAVADCSLGLNEMSHPQPGYTIHPNPASHELTISFDSGINKNASLQYQLVDSYGKIHLEHELQTNRIDISNIASGIYFFRILKDGHYLKTKKLIIQ
ncbi:MAG: T9SS type A sorting domain-containing protein [Bacteroidota bacterium]